MSTDWRLREGINRYKFNMEEEDLVCVEWVTDKNSFKLILDEIEKIIFRLRPISSIQAPIGYLTRYKYLFNPGESEKKILDNLISMVSQIEYLPLSYSVTFTNLNIDKLTQGRYLKGMVNILKAVLPTMISFPVSEIETVSYQIESGTDKMDKNSSIFVSFYPQTMIQQPIDDALILNSSGKTTSPIFVSREQLTYYQSKIDLSEIVGMDLLTDNLLGWYILQTDSYFYNRFREFSSETLREIYLSSWNHSDHSGGSPIKSFYRYPIISIPLDDQEYIEYLKNQKDFYLVVESFINHYLVDIPITSMIDQRIIYELGKMWEIEVLGQISSKNWNSVGPPFDILVVKSEVDFTIPIEEWILKSLQMIKNGSLPTFNVGGKCQNFDPTIENRIKLQYAATLAMVELSKNTKENLFLPLVIPSVYVLDNFTVSASFVRLEDVSRFKERLELILETADRWTLVNCNQFTKIDNPQEKNTEKNEILECLVHRWNLAQMFPDRRVLLVEVPGIQNNGTLMERTRYIVMDTDRDILSELVLSFKKGGSGYDLKPKIENYFEKYDLSARTEELRSYFRNLCSGSKDPISLTEIDEMNLEQLSSLIVTDEPIPYCFEKFSILGSGLDYNPVTQIPFSKKTRDRISLNQSIFNGVYPIGPIPGLLKEIPSIPMISPPIETTLIFTSLNLTERQDSKLQKFQKSNLQICEVLYPNQELIELFTIDTPDLNTLEEITQTLWDKGWFFSLWANAYAYYQSQLSVVVPRYIPTLISASSSPSAGQKGLIYMKYSI